MSANNKDRKDKLEELKYETRTLIFYEAPHKLYTTLECMLEIFGDRNIVLAKEITKIHEQYIRGKISTILEQLVNIKGEYVVLIECNNINEKDFQIENLNKLTLEEHYNFYENQKMEKKEIIKTQLPNYLKR